MQPIFNEQIKMWSDLGYPLPIEKNKMSGAIPLALDGRVSHSKKILDKPKNICYNVIKKRGDNSVKRL